MPRETRLDALGILQHIILKGLEGKEIFFRSGPNGLTKYLHRL
jgi:hypothetical protein